MLPKNTARATSRSSGSTPLAFRNVRLPVLRSRAFLIPAAKKFSLRKRAAYSGTTRRYNTSCACPTLAFTNNMDEKSVTSISPYGNASEKILCLSALTPSSSKISSCNHISWTRATGFSRKLILTTSYGASDTGLTTSLHASRPYGAALICWARLYKPYDVSSANARRHRRTTTLCLLRATHPPVETESSKWTPLRDNDCVQRTRQQPPPRRDTPHPSQTCLRTRAAMSSL